MVRDVLSRELRGVGRVGVRREARRHHEKIVCADAAVSCVPGLGAPAQTPMTMIVLLGWHTCSTVVLMPMLPSCDNCHHSADSAARTTVQSQPLAAPLACRVPKAGVACFAAVHNQSAWPAWCALIGGRACISHEWGVWVGTRCRCRLRIPAGRRASPCGICASPPAAARTGPQGQLSSAAWAHGRMPKWQLAITRQPPRCTGARRGPQHESATSSIGAHQPPTGNRQPKAL